LQTDGAAAEPLAAGQAQDEIEFGGGLGLPFVHEGGDGPFVFFL
jgi:hypothetical protein